MSSVVLSSLYSAISTAIYDELLTKQSTLYSFIGKNTDFSSAQEKQVKDNLEYDYFIKNNIAFAKKINMADVSFVTTRYNWESGVVFDKYDDNYYGSFVESVSVNTGGSGYVQATTSAYIAGGNGVDALLNVSVINGAVVGIGVIDGGHSFTSVPTVVISGAGTGATATAQISTNNLSASGKSKLSNSKFYVLTNDYNVYKCIDNNLGAVSTVMPTHISVSPVTLADGYVWKFMYHIPLGLRKKFLTSSFMPVFTVLSSSYYSNGGIGAVEIVDGGSGYSSTTPLSVYAVSDGIDGEFVGEINSTTKEIAVASVVNSGTGYNANVVRSIKSVSRTGTTVTVTTIIAHHLVVNKSITISGTGLVDGNVVITSVPTATTFTYELGSGTIATTTFGSARLYTNTPINIASLVRSNNVVTVTTSDAHYVNEGNTVTIAGATGFNGTYKIAKYISPTSFAFFQFGAATTVSGTGTIVQAEMGIANISRTSNVVTVTTQHVHNFKAPLSIATIARVSNIVTVTTALANTLLVGDTIKVTGTVNFDGTYTIASLISSTKFTFSSAGGDISESVGNVKYAVTIANQGTYNGTFAVDSVPSNTSLTYAQTASNDSTYVPAIVSFTTSLALSSNGGVGGKYAGNATAVLTPSILIKGGKDYTVAPSVYIKGTTGTGATATAFLTGTTVSQINVTAAGSGYTSEPIVYFNGGTVNQATATANISGGGVTSYSMSTNGHGYTSAPLVLIVGDGTGATATATISGDGVASVNMVSAGTGYTTATVYFAGGSDYCCSARAIVYNNTIYNIAIDNIIDLISITDPGVGYDAGIATSITIAGDGTGAALTPYIKNGTIYSVVIDNPGEGYTYADLTVTGDGVGAKLLTPLGTTNIIGQLATAQYNVEALAVSGAIESYVVTNGGSGYVSAPAVTITGNGSGATAHAVLSNGVVTKVVVDTAGIGYTYANVTFASGSATARAILPPYGGHGFNAISELYATKLLTYTKISDSDVYNTFEFTNEFYQYGIIANPRRYNSGSICTDAVVSPCVSVSGSFTLSNFPLNATVAVTVGGVQKTLTIVDRTSSALLLMAVDNYIPVIGDVLTNLGNSISYTATAIGLPTTNINTGSIIDVNNTTAFYKTPSQIITLRTLISL